MAYSFQQLKDLWVQAGGDPKYADMAAAVALAESSGNPDSSNTNSNGTIDRGLWQINSIHGLMSTYDPSLNARAAVSISKNGTDWRPWCSAYSNNNCTGTFLGQGANVLKYLPPGATRTGVIPPSDGSSNAVLSGVNIGGINIPSPGDVLKAAFGLLTGKTEADAASAIGVLILKYLAYLGAAIAGGIMASLGIWMIILERPTRQLKQIVGTAAPTASQAFITKRVYQGKTPRQPATPVPATGARTPAPAQPARVPVLEPMPGPAPRKPAYKPRHLLMIPGEGEGKQYRSGGPKKGGKRARAAVAGRDTAAGGTRPDVFYVDTGTPKNKKYQGRRQRPSNPLES